MIKTQVQIPDELYRRAKKVAEQREWSFAETVRRGLEYIVEISPSCGMPVAKWRLPKPVHMGAPLLPEEEWTAVCHD